MHEHGNVAAPLTQRGHVHGNDIQSEVKILAEVSGLVSRLQIAVGGGDDAHVYFNSLIAAHWPYFLFLQNPQQLGLQLQRQFADFIEEDGATVGCLEKAFLGLEGSGEGSLFVTEKFALNQRRHQRTTVHSDKSTSGEGAAEMNSASDKFLAGATFAGDEHGCTGIFEARNHAQNFLNFRRGTDNAVHSSFGIRALAQEFVFLDQANFFRHSAQEKPEFFERRKRLGDVVICAQLHGLHGGFDRAMPGHERNLGAGQKLFYFLQELEPRHVRHDHVG